MGKTKRVREDNERGNRWDAIWRFFRNIRRGFINITLMVHSILIR